MQCLSCAFLTNWLTKLAYFTKNWLSSYCSCLQYSLSFPCDTLVLCMNTVWLKVNPVRELRESCSVRFCEINLQSWHISQKIGLVPMVRAGSTHWVFLVTPWFFEWTQFDWRSIQWESYVNPVLCVFEKLAYKVDIFHKKLVSSYGSCWQYSLSFSCDTVVLCMNTVWLKVSPVRELSESCPVRFGEIGLQSWQI